MENFNAQKYRDDLAENIKKVRSVDSGMAQEYLEKNASTPEYAQARQEKNESQQKDSEDLKQIQEIKETLGVETGKEKVKNPSTALFEVFDKAEELFKNKKEFGDEGEKGAEKVKEISTSLRLFLEKFKGDYIAEYQRSGLTPEKFMYEYGIGSIEKERGGWGSKMIDEYNIHKQKEEMGKVRGRADLVSFSSFKMQVFKKFDQIKKRRKSLFGEWRNEETHEEWFTPKQEEMLYKLITGDKNFKPETEVYDVNRNYYDASKEVKTVVPGITLELHSLASPFGYGKQVSRSINTKWFGHKGRDSYINLNKDFIKSYLASTIRG